MGHQVPPDALITDSNKGHTSLLQKAGVPFARRMMDLFLLWVRPGRFLIGYAIIRHEEESFLVGFSCAESILLVSCFSSLLLEFVEVSDQYKERQKDDKMVYGMRIKLRTAGLILCVICRFWRKKMMASIISTGGEKRG
jgi:hypothetical protein